MSEWKEYKLSDIVLSANTGLDAIRRAPIVEEETGIKCLRIQDISQKKPFIKWGNSKVTSKDFERAQLLKDDIIMARTCSPGIVFKAKENLQAVFNNGLAKIRPNRNLTTADYLFYLFKSSDFIGHIYGISDGTSVQLNMKLGDLLSYKLNLPPIPEQTAIASVLGSLDDKIDLLHRQNATLEKMAETLFRQWFVEEAKEEWEEGTLGEVIEIYDNLRIPLSKMERDKKKDGQLYPYYGAAQIMDYSNDFIFDGEYILMGEDGTVRTDEGYPILQYATGKFWVNNHTHVLKAKYPYNNFFIWNYLRKKNIDEIVTGAVQPKINQANLKSIDFPKYPENLVIEFNKILEPFFKKINQNNTQIRTLSALRDTLLPKLMSGEVKVEIKKD